MIEKVMKAVKSSNKRRGRNITIGAVIGFLLSCTAVMGEDIGLKITQDNKNDPIKFNDSEYDSNNHKFSDNTFKDNTYTNNMTISAENASGDAYGIKLKLSDESSISIINNGTISGNSTKSTGNGIYNESGIIETLTNNGLISASSPTNGYGISNGNGIGILTNNGIISGSSSANGYGIYNNLKKIETLTNNGIISGSGSNGNGIKTNYGAIETLTNTGVIYGKTNAIVKGNGDIGIEKKGTANNYGILVNGNDRGEVVNLTIVNATPDEDNINDENLSKNQILNRGLIFKAVDGGYKVGEEDYKQFGAIYKDKDIIIGYEKDDENPASSNPITKKYTIINAKAIDYCIFFCYWIT